MTTTTTTTTKAELERERRDVDVWAPSDARKSVPMCAHCVHVVQRVNWIKLPHIIHANNFFCSPISILVGSVLLSKSSRVYSRCESQWRQRTFACLPARILFSQQFYTTLSPRCSTSPRVFLSIIVFFYCCIYFVHCAVVRVCVSLYVLCATVLPMEMHGARERTSEREKFCYKETEIMY